MLINYYHPSEQSFLSGSQLSALGSRTLNGSSHEFSQLLQSDRRVAVFTVAAADSVLFFEAEASADGDPLAGAVAAGDSRPAGQLAVSKIQAELAAFLATAVAAAACFGVDAAIHTK